MQITMLMFPGMTPLDLVGPLQVFSRWRGAHIETVWKTPGPLPTEPGATFLPSASFATAAAAPDVLFVPGGVAMDTVTQDPEVLAFLAERGARAAYVTSVCTGALALGAAGLLQGYRATTHWASLHLLADHGAVAERSRWVRDRDRITGGGVTAGIDFALALIADLESEAEARAITLMLEYAPAPPFDAGTPEAAGAATVAEVQARYAARRAP